MDLDDLLMAADLMRAYAADAGPASLAAVDLIANSSLLPLVALHIDEDGALDLTGVIEDETLTDDETTMLALVDALTNGTAITLAGLWQLDTHNGVIVCIVWESIRDRLADTTHG